MTTLDLKILFHRLLQHRDTTADSASLGPWLKAQLKQSVFLDLDDVPFAKASYTRNFVAREREQDCGFAGDRCFEALIMRWDKQAETCIHGHPAFSFYYTISGVFEIDMFSRIAENRVELQQTQRFLSSDTTWFSGQSGRYDNWIHRVRCLEPGLTFHIYSDDAKKGIVL